MIAVIEQLERVVEKLAKPGVLGLVGKRLEKKCSEDLSTYFDTLKHRLDYAGLANVVAYQRGETVRHGVEMYVRQTLRKMDPSLQKILEKHLIDAFVAAKKIEYATEAQQQPFSKVGQSATDAAAWAEKQAAQLVTDLDSTTIDSIADAISKSIEDQTGVQGAQQAIRELVDEMSVSRAVTIAATEINRAMSFAAIEKLTDDGVEYKRVILSPNACDDICVPNADQGAIPIDEDFDSGDAYPPFHPNCRCAVTGARAPE